MSNSAEFQGRETAIFPDPAVTPIKEAVMENIESDEEIDFKRATLARMNSERWIKITIPKGQGVILNFCS